MNFLKQLIMKPLEGYLDLTAWLIFAWLYFQIVLSATAIFCMLSVFGFYLFDFETALNICYGIAGVGAIAGVVWAERVRKTLGIITFHAYLLSTPEIEGWRDKHGNVIRKWKKQGSH
ncbi:hypothetical protein [Shewanella insulae]|uniref:hypothetical protein n=1 Tax=Shewanella insulae TaxID=2681496 RepID=UPI00247FDEF5|nr:hypothetical protein [Shewanella insulae]